MATDETLVQMPAPALLDLDTLEEALFPARPTEVRRRIQARWDRSDPYGSSISPVHYAGTGNQVVDLELTTLVRVPGDYERIDDFIKFMEATQAPDVGTGTTNWFRSRPSRYLFTWPGEVAFECIVESFSDQQTQFFAADGRVRMRTLSMSLVEVPVGTGVLDKRNVRAYGSIRAWQVI